MHREIDSTIVGTSFPPHRMEVTWRQTTNYAASINDPNPLYFDDQRPEGLIAHPLFATAVTWPATKRFWERFENKKYDEDFFATKVHYYEHLTFYKVIKPGDKLVIKSEVAAVLPHRAGTHLIIRYDVFDEQNLPVFREFWGTLLRGVKCVDNGASVDLPPHITYTDQNTIPTWEKAIHIDNLAPYIYDGMTNNVFSIHTSPAFAKSVGLPGIILHGRATLSLACREIINQEAGGNPQLLKIISCKFTDMIFPGSDIIFQLIDRRPSVQNGKKGTDLFFQVLNANGKKAISQGYGFIVSDLQ